MKGQAAAATVEEYLERLPPDRRTALEVVRKVILKNLDSDYEEGIQYGAIGYYVPHRVYPAGYHADPKQPLPFISLASQKNHMALYLMFAYDADGMNPTGQWFRDAWAKTGKKLDMGKSCVRFKKLEDLALDVIGESVRRVPARTYIDRHVTAAGARASARSKSARKRPTAAKPTKKAAAPAAKPAKKAATARARRSSR